MPIQTLDGIHVHQPHWLLLLAKAKKLAEALKKEQDASQWAGIPHEKLLQESFVEQLNSLQTLKQLVPLKAAKEHPPQDIIDILELLGKADNIPFNQLYSLAEDCADRYYTKVIKTLTQLLSAATLTPSIQNWLSWTDRLNPMSVSPFPNRLSTA